MQGSISILEDMEAASSGAPLLVELTNMVTEVSHISENQTQLLQALTSRLEDVARMNPKQRVAWARDFAQRSVERETHGKCGGQT